MVLPAGWHPFESPGTGRARVARVDPVCGPPDGDLPEKFVSEVAVEWRPVGIGVGQGGLFFDEVGKTLATAPTRSASFELYFAAP